MSQMRPSSGNDCHRDEQHEAPESNNDTRKNDSKRSSSSSSITVMQRTRKKLSTMGAPGGMSKFCSRASGILINYGRRGSRSSSSSSQPAPGSSSNNNKGARKNWVDDLQHATENQNAVRTLDLFRYADRRELAAIALGIVFMIYAASWQPISVFILATMASLMGRYAKQVELLKNLNETAVLATGQLANTTSNNIIDQPIRYMRTSLDTLVHAIINQTSIETRTDSLEFESESSSSSSSSLLSLANAAAAAANQTNPESAGANPLLIGNSSHHLGAQHDSTSPDDEYPILGPLQSLMAAIYDLSSPSSSLHYTDQATQDESLTAAVDVLLDGESSKFLRKSFEINGSAFALALTQLFSFFLGMTLITWAAKKQASRIKLMYFSSCLHQEVTWFEAMDNASGSSSSLNGLVGKFEDGIGIKLALLCYFLGHVALFALTAFYQMFSLAIFCMPFVLLIGITIAHLSHWQANSIGEEALFAKRSLQLAEEILAAIRTVFAFNGQRKEITRYSLSLEPVYRKSLIKHFYTALNTSLSKFSIFACFSIYCFYAKHLFPPYSERATNQNKATILAIMRGAEVSIVNILISIPFMEALQQSKGSIARIFVAIERHSRINAASTRGLNLDGPKTSMTSGPGGGDGGGNATSEAAPSLAGKQSCDANLNVPPKSGWLPSISFRMVQFSYADRSGPTTGRRRSTLPYLKLVGPYASEGEHQAAQMARRRSAVEEMTDEAIDATEASSRPVVATTMMDNEADQEVDSGGRRRSQPQALWPGAGRRRSAEISQMLGKEVRDSHLGSRVLRAFNLEIKAGQSVALVGPSGSGKSTVLALVQRLYEISDGQLLIGQHDIKDLNLAWLRNQIGLVGQEPRLFDMTIAENIMLGLAQDKFDELMLQVKGTGSDQSREQLMQQVIRAAKEANAHEFIARLPNGYGTRVGSGGVQLSGGQKQRIAIARALIREPKILLLDECTSALDTESEQRVHAAIKQSCKDPATPRTTLIVAHRLETIKHVDLIVVINEGQVVACGTHEELMKAAALATTSDSQPNSRQPAGGGGGGGGGCTKGNLLVEGAKIYKQLYDEQLEAKQQKHLAAAAAATGAKILEEPESERDDMGDEADGDGDSQQRGRQLESGENCLDGGRESGAKLGDNQDGKSSSHGSPAVTTVNETTQDRKKENASSITEKANFRYGDIFGLQGNMQAAAAAAELDQDESALVGKQQDSNNRHAKATALDDSMEQSDNSSLSSSTSTSSSNASTSSSGVSSSEPTDRTELSKLWHFLAIPKWSTLAAVMVCFLAGLILPLNLIAHSYLFSVFAYSELYQIGEYLQLFGLIMLSFSTFVFIVSFLQILLPGYVGEKLSVQLRVKTMVALLQKPMFYFDMDSNSAGAICDRFSCFISNLQSIAGTRIATMLEAVSTLAAGAIFGFGQNFTLSSFCLSFAVLVLVTTIIESQIMERETSLQQRYDAQLAHLMADALSNIKTIASLNREQFFVQKFDSILREREKGIGNMMHWLHIFLTSLKFVMPAMSWSASMYYGSYLLTRDSIDLQTIYIVCPVVLFAVNDTFRALVFLPELLKARKSIERLHQMNREFSPEVLQTLTFPEQLAEQHRLHTEQLTGAAESAGDGGDQSESSQFHAFGGNKKPSRSSLEADRGGDIGQTTEAAGSSQLELPSITSRRASEKSKKSISFVLDIPDGADDKDQANALSVRKKSQSALENKRLSNLDSLPNYMSARRKSSRLNSLVPRANARGRITFNEVEFAYPNRPSALVLDKFSLRIEPGESVALVGASGSGKSTTVAILEKFYDFHGGSIKLDGRDLRIVEPDWVRTQIGLVQQEPCLLSYTIGDNIRYGDSDRFISMDEVVEAARTANIHDFIMSLPDQYDTELSSSAYGSCQLSGGQRQRIAIARALVQNAPILIFDEATSALDNRSEQVVQDALRKARRGRTSLTIAHRLATVMDADKIAVVRDGKVVEVGRHEELLARPGGHYRKLWVRQTEEGVDSAGAP